MKTMRYTFEESGRVKSVRIQGNTWGELHAEMRKLIERMESKMDWTLHDIKKETEINPRDFFSAIYISFLGKNSGPKAGWFLSVLDKEFLEKRLGEVINL